MTFILSRAAPALLVLSTSFLVTACGSGNNTTPVAGPTNVGSTDVPIAATQDSDAAFNFVAMIVARGEANTDNPLVLSDATNDPVLATSETADAMPIAA